MSKKPDKEDKTPSGGKTPEEIAKENQERRNKEAAQKALNDITKNIDITKLDTVEKVIIILMNSINLQKIMNLSEDRLQQFLKKIKKRKI